MISLDFELPTLQSICGAPDASSTGHFLVRDWFGGRRRSHCVSGLMIVPAGRSFASIFGLIDFSWQQSIENKIQQVERLFLKIFISY